MKKQNQIIDVEIGELMKDSFLPYAVSSFGRMVPHIIDGLKPVQRRVLYTMWKNKIYNFEKCASIVGKTMEYVTTGDVGIYGALVVMGQKDRFKRPFVVSQGNFGYITDSLSEFAAMRYTEAALSEFVKDFYFPEDFYFTNMETTYKNDPGVLEPVVLPTLLPMGLVQGTTQGISVGYSSVTPPHSLESVAKCYIKYIESRKDVTKLQKFSKYLLSNLEVEFPNKCKIINKSEKGVLTGQGQLKVQGYYELDTGSRGKQIIRVTALPYLVEVVKFINVCEARMKNIEGYSGIRDLSSRDGILVEIIIKRDKSIQPFLDVLKHGTPFTSTLNYSLILNDFNTPARVSVQEIFEAHYKYKSMVLKKYFEDTIVNLQNRLDNLKGVAFILGDKARRSDFIKMIESSDTKDLVVKKIMKKWDLKGSVVEYLLSRNFLSMLNKRKELNDNIKTVTDDLKTTKNNLKNLDNYMIEQIKEKVKKHKLKK
jgi:Type IIA topoisomerase (DNA gyrase/topo II, topoisomerase IV), A subunit|nr:MAG TPA: DNA topoisomerase 2 alpha [Caudoviricetes sp.]